MQTDWQPECPELCPLPAQELLLGAAFGEGARASEAFRRWKEVTGFTNYSDIDFSSSRLLPIIYHNFRRHGIVDAWLPQMAALHRYHWMRNVITQNRFLEAAAALERAGCECVALGGFALAAGKYFDDPGERPLLDGELLLSVNDAPKARAALTELHWRDAAAVPPPVAGWRSEWWQSPGGQSLRIHYRWLPKLFPVVTIHRLWKYSEQVELGGVPLRIPDPVDLLVYACVANRRPADDGSHRFLWAVSVLRILQRGGGRLDWDRLWNESGTLCTLLPLREALGYLANTFDAPASKDWLAAACQVKILPSEQRPFYRATRQWSRYARTLGIAAFTWPWTDYAAAECAAERRPSIAACGSYWRWHARSEIRRLLSAPARHAAKVRASAESEARAA